MNKQHTNQCRTPIRYRVTRVFGILILCSLLSTLKLTAQSDTLTADESDVSIGIDSLKKSRFLVYPGFGVSLIRNDIAPAFFINLGYNYKQRYEVNLNTSSFFFFEQGADKNFKVYRNTFLNAEFLVNLSLFNPRQKNMNGLGVGYLIESKGQYFRNTTMMVYYKRRHGLFSVMPGILMADDFKEVFPVISIRL